jgi:hypothetical protein
MPAGKGFVEYPTFETGYGALKQATQRFRGLDPEAARATLPRSPMIFIVSRAALGFTPPEWAYFVTSSKKRSNLTIGSSVQFISELVVTLSEERSNSTIGSSVQFQFISELVVTTLQREVN